MRAHLRLLFPLVLLAATTATPVAPAQTGGCGTSGYGYAGRLSANRAHGVSATLSALAAPQVEAGHVAAWVGVGGVGEGPNGTNAWIQIGLSAFPGSESRLYYEVARPGAAPRYSQLAEGIRPDERFRVAVLEMSGRPEHWRVWLNGRAVSAPVHLPGSTGRWRPIVTAESWSGVGSACNRFSYRFDGVRVAAASGGSWRPFVAGGRFLDAGYRLVDRGGGSFVASAS